MASSSARPSAPASAKKRRHADDAVAAQPGRRRAGRPPAPPTAPSGPPSPGRHQRVDAAVVGDLRQRPGHLVGHQRRQVAQPLAGRLGAQRDGAVGEVAAEARRAADDVVAIGHGAGAQLLEQRAAQVLLDLVARVGDRQLGQHRDGRQVQELGRLGRRLAAERQRRRPRSPRPTRPAPRARRAAGTADGLPRSRDST